MKVYSLYNVYNFSALYQSAKDCLKDVRWKASTQMFEMKMIEWVAKLSEEIKNKSYRSKGFTEFYLIERGKRRFIQSVHISERCVQKSLCNNVVKPIVEPLLIEDNAASRKGKGTQFAIDRLIQHLSHHVEKYGKSGGILVMDLHDYFHSIDHDKLIAMYSNVIEDKDVFGLLKYFIKCFDKGLGLGSEISQISAIFYANSIDHYVKDTLRIDEYARYMDDSYLIYPDIEKLKEFRDTIASMYADLGIEMNMKKTQIIDLSKGDFEYLKKRYHIRDDGTICIRPVRKFFTKLRQKLKKQKKMLDENRITMESIRQSYNSSIGMIKEYDCQKSLYSLEKLYWKLFNQSPLGEDIDDVVFKKWLYKSKQRVINGELTREQIYDSFAEWLRINKNNEFKNPVRKHYKDIVKSLYGVSWIKLKGDQDQDENDKSNL